MNAVIGATDPAALYLRFMIVFSLHVFVFVVELYSIYNVAVVDGVQIL